MTDQTPPKRTYEQLEAELASTVMLFTQQGNTVVADLNATIIEQKAQIAALHSVIVRQNGQIVRYEAALNKLSCLGNGNRRGNSFGNDIAWEALNPPAQDATYGN
jgi:hypothetical protein